MHRGYIKLWRKIEDSTVFQDPELLKLWLLCLLQAGHKEKTVVLDGLKTTLTLYPGQFVTGRYTLHELYYLKTRSSSRKSALTLWRWLQILENMQILNIKSYNKYSIITICNWKEHQENEQQMNNRRTTDEQQMNTNKNGKNGKNEKNTTFSSDSNEYRLAEMLFSKIKERKPDIKKPNMQVWAKHIDLMVRIDKRDIQAIERIICLCQEDPFWQNNILSTEKLRAKYDMLDLKLRAKESNYDW